jgi:hypothetical protein
MIAGKVRLNPGLSRSFAFGSHSRSTLTERPEGVARGPQDLLRPLLRHRLWRSECCAKSLEPLPAQIDRFLGGEIGPFGAAGADRNPAGIADQAFLDLVGRNGVRHGSRRPE